MKDLWQHQNSNSIHFRGIVQIVTFGALQNWFRGRAARHWSAKPGTAVRIRSEPLNDETLICESGLGFLIYPYQDFSTVHWTKLRNMLRHEQ